MGATHETSSIICIAIYFKEFLSIKVVPIKKRASSFLRQLLVFITRENSLVIEGVAVPSLVAMVTVFYITKE